MSSFWSTGDGEDIRDKVDVDKDLPGNNNFELLPNNTWVLARIEEAGIKEDRDGNRRAFATMEILKPEGYARRKLFPSFWVYDNSPHWGNDEEKIKEERLKQITRFTKMDAACGGKLARKDGTPTSDDISIAFTGKEVIVQVMLMEPKNGDDPRNWYRDYARKGSKDLSEAKPAPKPATKRPVDEDLDGDEIPF